MKHILVCLFLLSGVRAFGQVNEAQPGPFDRPPALDLTPDPAPAAADLGDGSPPQPGLPSARLAEPAGLAPLAGQGPMRLDSSGLSYLSDTAASQPVRRAPFSQGSWEFDVSGSYTYSARFRSMNMHQVEAGVGYYIFDDFEFSLRGNFINITQGGPNANGGGFELFARWHILKIDRFSLYIDGGGGRMWLDEESPPGGTEFNWIGTAGIGATLRITDHVHIMGGGRYYHFSNGNIHGPERNPSFDGVQIYAGLMVTL